MCLSPSAGAMSSVNNWRALQSAVRKCSLQQIGVMFLKQVSMYLQM